MRAQLPSEVWDLIIDYLHNDRKSLDACSLTCRAWLRAARYHRFRHVSLSPKRARGLYRLLYESPGFGHVIKSVELYGRIKLSTAWKDESCLFLAALPALSKLKLSHMTLSGSVLTNITDLRISSLKHISIRRCGLPRPHMLGFIEFIASFRSLESIYIADMSFHATDPMSPIDPPRPPPNVRSLAFGSPMDAPQLLFDWLTASEHRIESFSYQITSGDDVEPLQHMLTTIGPTLTQLNLHIDTDTALDRIFAGHAFTLAPCTALRTCRLALSLPEMCVPANNSLRWVHRILSQLAAPGLAHLALSICADAMDNFGALASECAVHQVSLVPFRDLFALDWVVIGEVMCRPAFESLRQFVLEGRGQPELLDAFVKKRCPEFHARGILEYRVMGEFVGSTVDLSDNELAPMPTTIQLEWDW
ncbi:hypothetical protein WOLCODRAFT_104088 [Wolfiporia cocos MD-104 SS10]|uniref:F-box domain-containing protein n=1 Tax=Wolfiporia cocos (strain MD-104) TaxID=742152 RepID=A0A2H3JQF1_WOLCO|nr:hypothetical protein WOLCODRAFT_104088 [Wolfiporia cocos MD-104 SS10]